MSDINDFKDLRIWQKGITIAEKCYSLTLNFPKHELYGMVQQIRRSAVSIPANIAEGYGRGYTREYIRFLNIRILSKFENLIKPFFKTSTLNTKENQQLTQLRDWLLPMLMNGQVTVK